MCRNHNEFKGVQIGCSKKRQKRAKSGKRSNQYFGVNGRLPNYFSILGAIGQLRVK
jgi:hypothetical protein